MPRFLILPVIPLMMMCLRAAQDLREATYNLNVVIVDEQGNLFFESVEMSFICSGAVLQNSFSTPGRQPGLIPPGDPEPQ